MVLTDKHRNRIAKAMERFGDKQDWAMVAEEQYFAKRNKDKKEARAVSGKLSEHQEQVLVVEWMRAKGLFFFAVPNGVNFNQKNVAAAARQMNYLKAEGFLGGCSDLVILTPIQKRPEIRFVGLEMKSLGGKVSDKQTAFGSQMVACGGVYLVSYGHIDAIGQLEALYDNK